MNIKIEYDRALREARLAAVAQLPEATRAKIASRGRRMAASVNGVDPSTVDPNQPATLAQAAASLPLYHGRDGAAASGRFDAKFKPIVATRYEGDRKVTGALVRLRQRANSALERKQAVVTAGVRSADHLVGTVEFFAKVRADYAPGGERWRYGGRSAKRAWRAAIKQADSLAGGGEYQAAISAILGDRD